MSREQYKTFIKTKLASDDRWARKALLRIYEKQTKEKKRIQGTTENNAVGFTGFDGEILSSLADQLTRRGTLTEKQMTVVKQKTPKYWRQILQESDPALLAKAMGQMQTEPKE